MYVCMYDLFFYILNTLIPSLRLSFEIPKQSSNGMEWNNFFSTKEACYFVFFFRHGAITMYRSSQTSN